MSLEYGRLREDPDFRVEEISYEQDITIFNRTKLKINIEGCVNTLSEECKAFYNKYGKFVLLKNWRHHNFLLKFRKIEKILEDSLALIPSPSPSMKIQIIGGKYGVIRQNIAGWCLHNICFQKLVDNAQQCFAFTPQANFLAHNLNFHSRLRWWDQIQACYLPKSFLL